MTLAWTIICLLVYVDWENQYILLSQYTKALNIVYRKDSVWFNYFIHGRFLHTLKELPEFLPSLQETRNSKHPSHDNNQLEQSNKIPIFKIIIRKLDDSVLYPTQCTTIPELSYRKETETVTEKNRAKLSIIENLSKQMVKKYRERKERLGKIPKY